MRRTRVQRETSTIMLEDVDEQWQPIKTDVLTFILNGKKKTVVTSDIGPETTLNEYLREKLHLTGTKYMCNEGGCGACIVCVTILNPRTNVKETKAVNSCLVALLSCQNWEIATVEHLGNQYDGLHEIQQKIVQFNSTQCGFCTPGMVMNMYALQQNDKTKMAEIENAFGSNMCRCTGYRSILTAFKSMASDADPTLLGIIPDIEELKVCSRTGTYCKEECQHKNGEQPDIELPLEWSLKAGDGSLQNSQNWYKVQTIKEIFNLFRRNRGKSYQLVAGNTARGVYKDLGQKDYYIDISGVKELKDYELNTKSLKLGANMTLEEVMTVCDDVSKRDDGFKYLSKFVEHLDLVAHIPVRNIGTLAGNLSIKHEHNEFPSDIFVLLETVGAKINIDTNVWRKPSLSPRDYLDYNMADRIILSIDLPPLDASYKLETYKIMPRAQNAHAYLNAGFLLRFEKENVISSASFVFGGVAPDFIHAQDAEAFIKGKSLFDNGNIQNLFAKLYAELHPLDIAPDPSPAFRRDLAVALLYKFILSIAPEGVASAENKSGGEKLQRAAVSTGVQDYKTKESMYPIGEPVGKLEARIQATGEAKYIIDKPDLPDQCFAAFVLGNATAGSILQRIDASEVLELEGVEGFYQASDIEDLGGVNSFLAPNAFFYFQDEEVFLPIGQPVKFYYQPVGVIVARSRRLAQSAADMVKVTFEHSSKSPILTTKEALETDKSRVHHLDTKVARKQNTEVPIKFQGVFESQWKYHYHMELQVVSVVPGDNGCFDIYPSTQWIEHCQTSIHRALNIPANKLRVSVKRLGGSFGGKLTRNNWTAVACTLAALKLRKPVKFLIPLEVNMNVIGKRNCYRSEYDIGVDESGVIGYLNNNVYSNIGAFQNNLMEEFLLDVYEGTYVSDAFQTDTFWVRTDNPAGTTFRAPGGFEGCAIIENIIDHIASKLDKDPIDVRLANLKPDASPVLKKLIEDALKWSDYRQRRADIEEYNKLNRWRKKGIALVPMSFSLFFFNPYNVQVSIYQADGTVAISHCGIEMGQGINTKTAQVAAYLFGIPLAMVDILPSNNFTSPNGAFTGGSVTTESVIIALKLAAETILARINTAARAMNLSDGAPWLDRVQAAFNSGVSLTVNQHFSEDTANSTTYKVYGVGVSEVEVDLLTGAHVVSRVDLLEDAGDSLNPTIDIGQCEGAFVMGMGCWTIEKIVLDEDGALATNNTWWYKVPGARDIPLDFRVKLPDGVPNPVTPFKNKATTEPPMCLSFSVPLAIKHALKSARLQANPNADPWMPMEGPTTIEWIFNNALPDFKQYKL